MSSPEYEGFGLTENDMQDAMDPLRRQRKRTKEESIYGMWAESDEELDGRAGFGSKKQGKGDISRPVSFVSGGLKKSSAEMEAEEEKGGSAKSEKVGTSQQIFKRTTFAGSGESVGDWERHTKGIGQKLLSKMGWEKGKGLGKNAQGINKPVEAFVRKGKGALGFYGSERVEPVAPPVKSSKTKEKASDSIQQKLGQWKKTPGERKKVNYVVRSAADIAASGEYQNFQGNRSETADAITSVKVIDMTGKDKVVYSGYSSISRQYAPPGDGKLVGEDDDSKPHYFDVPELRHNLRLLVLSAEEDVIENLKTKDRENNQLALLEHDKIRLEQVTEEEEHQINQLEKIVAMVNDLGNIKNLDEAIDLIQEMHTSYPDEYRLYSLERLLHPIAEPILKDVFANFDPLNPVEQEIGLTALLKLKQLFTESEHFSDGSVGLQNFDALIWETWIPAVRQTIVNKWNPRDPENLVLFFEKWIPVLPDWIWDNICDQFLVPKLLSEAENWNPLTDPIPVHSWVHPWLSLLHEKLEPVHVPIRQKIGSALANWHPSDSSARILLKSWVNVWSEGHMKSFLMQHVAPKIGRSMQELVIDPRQQNLDIWNWTFAWIDLLPHPFFVSLLDRVFFPKWHLTLAAWLDSSDANYQEITKWYSGWKSMIPSQLAEEPNIKENLSKGLAMMNQVLTGGTASSLLSTTPQQFVPQPSYSQPLPQPQPAFQAQTSAVSFKELIQRRAEAYGIVFMPVNRRDGHQQTYQLGRVVLYIDRNVVFVSSGGIWKPVSIEELFSLA